MATLFGQQRPDHALRRAGAGVSVGAVWRTGVGWQAGKAGAGGIRAGRSRSRET